MRSLLRAGLSPELRGFSRAGRSCALHQCPATQLVSHFGKSLEAL
ncbi:hypothetical protein AK812_SmicGene48719, partial [Symbiodinium microadriaticum]